MIHSCLMRGEGDPHRQTHCIQWVEGFPKTRSGEIICRILHKITANELSNLGDSSTLADPLVGESLLANQKILRAG